jgi:uncharacterized membrane protein
VGHRGEGASGERRPPALLLVVLAVAIGGGLLALWPRGEIDPAFAGILGGAETARAEVVSVVDAPCPGAGEAVGDLPGAGAVSRCPTFSVVISSGPDAGTRTTVPGAGDQGAGVAEGDTILVARVDGVEGISTYVFADRFRLTPLWILGGLFAAVVVLLGRLRGLAALGGLIVATGLLAVFVVPAILHGRPPVLVAVVGAAAIAALVLYVAHGVTVRTTTAVFGTLAGLLCAAVLSWIWVPLANLTGLVSDDAFVVRAIGVDVDVAGLLIAGIVIGAVGAIDDVAVTQASTVFEIREADPSLPQRGLYRAGMRVGRDHVGSIVNTLVLAYAGASLPAFLLFQLSARPLGEIVNAEILATEIVRTLTGSIGLVLAVPITTWLAARAAASVPPGPGRRDAPTA